MLHLSFPQKNNETDTRENSGIPPNLLFIDVTPLNQELNRFKFLKFPYLLRCGFKKVWFFLHSEMPKSRSNLEKTVFFTPSIIPLNYPKYVTPNFTKCNP